MRKLISLRLFSFHFDLPQVSSIVHIGGNYIFFVKKSSKPSYNRTKVWKMYMKKLVKN